MQEETVCRPQDAPHVGGEESMSREQQRPKSEEHRSSGKKAGDDQCTVHGRAQQVPHQTGLNLPNWGPEFSPLMTPGTVWEASLPESLLPAVALVSSAVLGTGVGGSDEPPWLWGQCPVESAAALGADATAKWEAAGSRGDPLPLLTTSVGCTRCSRRPQSAPVSHGVTPVGGGCPQY